MIMGAGKTTVVGPLLAMLLANSKTLVVEVLSLVSSFNSCFSPKLLLVGGSSCFAGFLHWGVEREIRSSNQKACFHFCF